MFFNIHNGDDPLLNFEFVKSAKFFFHCFILAGASRQRGLAVSDPACVRSVWLYPRNDSGKTLNYFVFLQQCCSYSVSL